MELSSIILNTKSAWVDYPGLPGFEVEVVNLSRKELTSLRKRCITMKHNRSTRMPEETLDEPKFLSEFSKAVVKGWKGLTLENLQEILLIEVTPDRLKDELPYSESNAKLLIESSTDFDTWLNEVIFDLDNFRTRAEG